MASRERSRGRSRDSRASRRSGGGREEEEGHGQGQGQHFGQQPGHQVGQQAGAAGAAWWPGAGAVFGLPPAPVAQTEALTKALEAMTRQNQESTRTMELLNRRMKAQPGSSRRGRSRSVESPDANDINIKEGLKRMHLEAVELRHLPVVREVRHHCRAAADRLKGHKEPLVQGPLRGFYPSYAKSEDTPKGPPEEWVGFAKYVAAWWGRALTCSAAFGHSKRNTMYPDEFLNAYLNIVQVANEHNVRTAIEFGESRWRHVYEQTAAGVQIDVAAEMAFIDRNEVTGLLSQHSKRSAGGSGGQSGQERRRSRSRSRRRSQSRRRSASKQRCTKCGRTGHDARRCQNKVCTYCKKIGHTAENCYQKRDDRRGGMKAEPRRR